MSSPPVSVVSLVSLVIPTCNRASLLTACLEAVVPQIPGDGSVELIVSDDSRDFQTRDLLAQRWPQARWLQGPRRGPGANRNAGVAQARGQWLVFVDDDCIPQPGFLEAYREAFREAAAAGPAGENTIFAGATFRLNHEAFPLMQEAAYHYGQNDLPPACNFALSRALYTRCGGFDERYRVAFEDMELFARLRATGVPVRYLPKARAEHPPRPLPPARTLARRWEARVTSTYDFGASTGQLLWRLPRHIAQVIVSRFYGRRLCADTLGAAAVFAKELLLAFWMLPGWVWHHRRQPRSDFWKGQEASGKLPPKFGL